MSQGSVREPHQSEERCALDAIPHNEMSKVQLVLPCSGHQNLHNHGGLR